MFISIAIGKFCPRVSYQYLKSNNPRTSILKPRKLVLKIIVYLSVRELQSYGIVGYVDYKVIGWCNKLHVCCNVANTQYYICPCRLDPILLYHATTKVTKNNNQSLHFTKM